VKLFTGKAKGWLALAFSGAVAEDVAHGGPAMLTLFLIIFAILCVVWLVILLIQDA